jgi:hypothetical protein
MPNLLNEEDFQRAARLIGCDKCAVKAVATVESRGNGFLQDGRVKLLFEGHWFYKFTQGKFATSHPDICYPKWDRSRYAKGATPEARGQGEWLRFERALALNRQAALLSASYGKFQIMGFNHAICHYTDVESFFNAMRESEGRQLDAFCHYVIENSLADEMRDRRWADFALRYNGKDFRKNRYDTLLMRAYVDCVQA